MFRHIVIAALRNMAANKLISAIAIGGLAIGLMAAILAGIITANQYSYDHFIPGSGRVYYAELENHDAGADAAGGGVSRIDIGSPLDLAKYLRQVIPEIAVARLQGDARDLRHGAVEAQESFYWADPNIFQLLALPVLYGRLDTALARPDGIVIPRAIAEKYFGRDNVVGETLELDRKHALTVTAVIADFPAHATTLRNSIFASGQAAYSTMAIESAQPSMGREGFSIHNSNTLVRISPGLSLGGLEARASAMVDSFVPKVNPHRRGLRFMPMDQVHVSPDLSPGVQSRLLIFDAVGLLILFLACVNFVNLFTARAAWRGVEIGVRKVMGAARRSLIAQFLGESVLQALAGLVIAVVLVEWSLPALNNFLVAGAVFDYWRDPVLAGALLSGTILVGILAGAYPALVLSSFRPAVVLKGLTSGSGRVVIVRQVLVMAQFAILVTLLIAAGIVFLQDRYATRDALRLNTDQMLVVRTLKCEDAFKLQVAALPGVRGAACSDATFQPDHSFMGDEAALPGGGHVGLSLVSVGYRLFELYGLKPLAGRFFAAGHGDAIPDPAAPDFMAHYILNEAAVRKLGFASRQAALGQTVKFVPPWVQMGLPAPKMPAGKMLELTLSGIVVGVVRDFAMTSGDKDIEPTVYSVGVPMSGAAGAQPAAGLLSIKLGGHDIPETLVALDALWLKAGTRDPVTGLATLINRTFVDAYIAELEVEVLRQAEAFAVFAGVAMFLACLGLVGIAVSIARRRTKEIGVRKAMGADNAQIVSLLLWQFAQPVLWANVIAWPVAWWLMRRWLSGFAYHVALQWWVFAAASLAALAIALLTVAGQAWMAARQKPVLALRYE